MLMQIKKSFLRPYSRQGRPTGVRRTGLALSAPEARVYQPTHVPHVTPFLFCLWGRGQKIMFISHEITRVILMQLYGRGHNGSYSTTFHLNALCKRHCVPLSCLCCFYSHLFKGQCQCSGITQDFDMCSSGKGGPQEQFLQIINFHSTVGKRPSQ